MGARLSRRALAARLALVALALLALFDLTRAPARQWTARAELGLIAGYRRALSRPLAAVGVSCRFTPSCSRYAEQAIRRYGAVGGTARAAWRLVRCGPWTSAGTADPVR